MSVYPQLFYVPSEFKRHVNGYSGFLDPSYKYANKNMKGLFYTRENQKYLEAALIKMLGNPGYVQHYSSNPNDALGAEQKAHLLTSAPALAVLRAELPDMIQVYPLPYDEDFTVTNPLLRLHLLNQDFLTTTATNFIQTPDALVADYYQISPETGKRDFVEYEYGPESYSDGYWHPEQLFTNSQRNRTNAYWEPMETTFTSWPSAGSAAERREREYYAEQRGATSKSEHGTKSRGATNEPKACEKASENMSTVLRLGHRYNSRLYQAGTERAPIITAEGYTADDLYRKLWRIEPQSEHDAKRRGATNEPQSEHGTKYRGATNEPKASEKASELSKRDKRRIKHNNQFPRWQYSVNHRYYDRGPEGLREAGEGDRRVQRPAGYNMADLFAQPSYAAPYRAIRDKIVSIDEARPY